MATTERGEDCPERSPAFRFAESSPMRTPRWRWEHAQLLAACPGNSSWTDDAPTLAAVEFIRARERGLPPHPANADFAAALALFEGAGPRRWRLESVILTGISPERVAATLGLAPGVVAAYECLFFDVRSRLDTRAWIAAHTYRASPSHGFARDDLAALWQWVGYHRGEHALDLVHAVTTGVGRELYDEESLESAELFVLVARLNAFQHRDRVLQLELRLKAEEVGAHPSSYHRPRTGTRGSKATRKKLEDAVGSPACSTSK